MLSPSSSEIKPPTTFGEQIQILKDRGLTFINEDLAIRALKRINYYRLSAYGLSLKENDRYFEGVTFEQIVVHALTTEFEDVVELEKIGFPRGWEKLLRK